MPSSSPRRPRPTSRTCSPASGGQARAVREAAGDLGGGRAADRRGRACRSAAASSRSASCAATTPATSISRPPGRGGDRGAAAHPLRAPQPERPRLLRLRDGPDRLRGARGRRRTLAARRGDHPGDRACAADDEPRAEGLRDPHCCCSRPRRADRRRRGLRQRGLGYDIRCEVVGEDGTLELLDRQPWRARRPAERLDDRRRLPQRFATAYRSELQAWSRASAGPSAWDGYAAASVSEAAVQSLEAGRRSTCGWPDARSAAPRPRARARPPARTASRAADARHPTRSPQRRSAGGSSSSGGCRGAAERPASVARAVPRPAGA